MDNSKNNNLIESVDNAFLIRLVMDAFRRIIMHYGMWFAQAEHQFGFKDAVSMESRVWDQTTRNQLGRLGKSLGISVSDGVPDVLSGFSRTQLLELMQTISINWLANDGIWFQAVEKKLGMNDAKRCNDTCWTRYSPYEAHRVKHLLNLPEKGGIQALEKALSLRMYAFINQQTLNIVDENTLIFQMNDCRVQAARKRKGLEDYPCKSVGLVEYPYFAKTIDPRIHTECIGCPPDKHPEDWYCSWKFTLIPD
ncbi:MAG: DUF6125 family protein [Desulfobacterales bacterium]